MASSLARTSAGVGMMPPVRPKKSTGARPATARRTSSTIWPMFISTDRYALARPKVRDSSSTGKGHRVMGRTRPTLRPRARALTTALCAMRAVAPNDTMTMSASSAMKLSARCSRALMAS